MKRIVHTVSFLAVMLLVGLNASAEAPKYGPAATRLFKANEYIRKNPAPDFWALIPYYVHQETPSSCSVASVAAVVNAARASKDLTAADELATHEGILKNSRNTGWMSAAGKRGKGVTLDQLANNIEVAMKAYGVGTVKTTVLHADQTAEFKKKLHDILVANEKSANDFIIANFLQSEFTGDPEGVVGHISPVAAYDEQNKRILILDVDRKYYEPYWVSEETFIKGMATSDKTANKLRGFVHVTF